MLISFNFSSGAPAQSVAQLVRANEALRADELPDYELAIEGIEAFRILQNPKEDLQDTAFLELPGGATLRYAC